MNHTSSEFPLFKKTGSGSPWKGARLLDRDGTVRQEKEEIVISFRCGGFEETDPEPQTRLRIRPKII